MLTITKVNQKLVGITFKGSVKNFRKALDLIKIQAMHELLMNTIKQIKAQEVAEIESRLTQEYWDYDLMVNELNQREQLEHARINIKPDPTSIVTNADINHIINLCRTCDMDYDVKAISRLTKNEAWQLMDLLYAYIDVAEDLGMLPAC